MKLIKKIVPFSYCDESFIWWEMNRSDKGWVFVLELWLFIGLLRMSMSNSLRFNVKWQRKR